MHNFPYTTLKIADKNPYRIDRLDKVYILNNRYYYLTEYKYIETIHSQHFHIFHFKTL